jgi:hypothetical protein
MKLINFSISDVAILQRHNQKKRPGIVERPFAVADQKSSNKIMAATGRLPNRAVRSRKRRVLGIGAFADCRDAKASLEG